MSKLIRKPQASEQDALTHPSPGLVFECPNCKVGHQLQTKSIPLGTVLCTGCNEEFSRKDAIPSFMQPDKPR